MKIGTVTSILASMTSAVLLLAAAPSHAVDEKILPGSICQPTSDLSASRMFYSGGSVVNFTQSSNGTFQDARLHCPIVRDRVNVRWKSVYVRVRDNSSSASVRCTMSNYNAYASASYNATRSSGDSFRGLRSLGVGALSGQYSSGAYHVYCTLPTNTHSGDFAAIHSIRLVEE